MAFGLSTMKRGLKYLDGGLPVPGISGFLLDAGFGASTSWD